MADCIHCGTSFTRSNPDEPFCCKGCEFVYEMIREEGLDRYYSLREGTPIKPVRSVPFESHDFSWLEEYILEVRVKSPTAKTLDADFCLEGISCIGCVWLVEKLFLRRAGALEASAHPASGRVHLSWVVGEMDLPAFAHELVSFGYTLAPRRGGSVVSESGAIGARLGLCGAFMMNAMGFALPSYLGMPDDFAFAGLFELVGLLTATLSMMVGASYFITRAWKALGMRILHIDLPIALGLLIAYAGSFVGWVWHIRGLMYFDFVSTFVFLMLVGRYLQIAAMDKNRSRLQRQRPIPETMRSPDRVERIALDDLVSGLRFELNPGQSLPVAAVLDQETADFSLEWINGEAECCNFSAGRTVPAGSIYLGKSPVTFTASETWAESMLAKLVANDRPAVRVVAFEKLLKFYLLAVLVVGLAGFWWWSYFYGFSLGLQVMISVFVVSCPCSLGVSLPMADEIAGSMMERLGVFIRQPLLWTRLCRVKTVIFDKTGTLTLERPVLMDAGVVGKMPDAARLALARLASGSLHPVSRALLEALGRDGQRMLREEAAVAVEDVPGSGRFFLENGDEWSLGKPGWRSEATMDGISQHDAELVKNGQVIRHFRFQESLRADAISSLAFLKKLHYRLVILSGDRQAKVRGAASVLGISPSDTYAALQPGEKESIVQQLDRHDTLYLGDGANDSLAFNAAWTTGTPVVDRSLLEAKADFYFMGQSLSFLPQLLHLAKRRQRVARYAFAFALCYNFTAIFISLQGQMSPLLAAILMPLSSIVSLAIVSFGLRDGSGKNRRVAIAADKIQVDDQTVLPASHHDSESDRLRPSTI